jgi:hypothetical protein
MQLGYGNYLFPVNATLLTSSLETLVNTGGQFYAQRRSFHVTGYLSGSGQDQITQAENALKTALSVPYRDLIFRNDDGSRSSEVLLNAGSITGVLIKNLSFPETKGPEYATIRSFSFTAEAEYPLPGTGDYLLEFHETLSFSGGGQLYVCRPAINGPAQRQLVYPLMPFSCVQSGVVVGYQSYPPAPAQKFPSCLKQAPRTTQESPTRRGKGYQGYKLTYEYHFESPFPLTGASPTMWIS